MESDLVSLTGIVKPGHQVASGFSPNSPYERGTLEMQLPLFQKLGLDLSSFFLGTINISIAPNTFKLIKPKHTFHHVKWHRDYDAETFSFSACGLVHRGNSYQGLIYYPHPETKIGHFQDDSILEAIAPKIPDLTYGDRITLEIDPQEIQLNPQEK